MLCLSAVAHVQVLQACARRQIQRAAAQQRAGGEVQHQQAWAVQNQALQP